MASVACIGECMVELRQAQGGQSAGQSSGHGQGGGLYSRGFGGDTLNTAVYLARLEVKVDYLTALGDDALSDEMIAAWNAEGVGTRRVVAAAGQAARPLHDPDGCEGRAPVLPLARQCGGAPVDEPAGDGRAAQLADELRHRLSLRDHALDLRCGRARAPVRGDQAGAPARHPLRVRHQLPRARMAGPRRRPRGLCRGVCGRRHRADLDRGSARALSRREPRAADGAHSRRPSWCSASPSRSACCAFPAAPARSAPSP